MKDHLAETRRIIGELLSITDSESMYLDADIKSDLGADSLDTVEMVMAFEEEYGTEFPDGEVEKLRTINEIATYLEGKFPSENAQAKLPR